VQSSRRRPSVNTCIESLGIKIFDSVIKDALGARLIRFREWTYSFLSVFDLGVVFMHSQQPSGLLRVAGATLVLAIGGASTAFGQLSINWYTIDGGGGTSSGGTFTLSGTIGQPDAGAAMTGGTFTLNGGFWAGAVDGTLCPWQVAGCEADYDNSGGIDGDDVIAFFADWDSGETCADVDLSEGVDGDDVILFFAIWDVSGC